MRLGHQEIIKPLPSEALKPVTCHLSPVTYHLSPTINLFHDFDELVLWGAFLHSNASLI
jgi:hypothetical protein